QLGGTRMRSLARIGERHRVVDPDVHVGNHEVDRRTAIDHGRHRCAGARDQDATFACSQSVGARSPADDPSRVLGLQVREELVAYFAKIVAQISKYWSTGLGSTASIWPLYCGDRMSDHCLGGVLTIWVL